MSSVPPIQPAPIRVPLQGLPSPEWVRWFNQIQLATQTVAANANTLTTNSTNLAGVQTDLTAIQATLNALESELAADEARLAADEAQIAANTAAITALEASAGSSGLGSSGPTPVSETPAGVMNGINVTFTLSNAPSPAASLTLYLNGVEQVLGVDYTISGATITFSVAPKSSDYMTAQYTH